MKLLLLHIIVMLYSLYIHIFMLEYCCCCCLAIHSTYYMRYEYKTTKTSGLCLIKKKNKNVLEQDGKWRNYIIKMHFVNTEMKNKRKNVRIIKKKTLDEIRKDKDKWLWWKFEKVVFDDVEWILKYYVLHCFPMRLNNYI